MVYHSNNIYKEFWITQNERIKQEVQNKKQESNKKSAKYINVNVSSQ